MAAYKRTQNLYGDKLAAAYVDASVIAALNVLARLHGRSRSEEIRHALARHIVRESQSPQPLRQS